MIVPGLLLAGCGNDANRAAAASGIPDKLICQCSCGTILTDCEPTCTHQDPWLATIGAKLAAGQTEEEILQYFVDRYGPAVLASRSHT